MRILQRKLIDLFLSLTVLSDEKLDVVIQENPSV